MAEHVLFHRDKSCMIASDEHIRMPLVPGNYTLLLYEPMPQSAALRSCVSYDFKLQLGYIRSAIDEDDAAKELFAEKVCHLESLPLSLNNPGYIGNGTLPHVMHLHKTFRFQPQVGHHDISFQISAHSTASHKLFGIRQYIFRVYTPWQQSVVQVRPSLLASDDSLVGNAHDINQDSFAAILPEGSYKLRLSFTLGEAARFLTMSELECISFDMEIGLAPMHRPKLDKQRLSASTIAHALGDVAPDKGHVGARFAAHDSFRAYDHCMRATTTWMPLLPEFPTLPMLWENPEEIETAAGAPVVSDATVNGQVKPRVPKELLAMRKRPWIAILTGAEMFPDYQFDSKGMKFQPRVIAEHPFEITQRDVVFHAELASDFLTNHVGLYLEHQDHILADPLSTAPGAYVEILRGQQNTLNMQTLSHVVLKPGRYKLVLRLHWYLPVQHMHQNAAAAADKHLPHSYHLPRDAVESTSKHCVAFELRVRMEDNELQEANMKAAFTFHPHAAHHHRGDHSPHVEHHSVPDMVKPPNPQSFYKEHTRWYRRPGHHAVVHAENHFVHPHASLHHTLQCSALPHAHHVHLEQLPHTLNSIRFLDNPHPDGSGPLARVHHRARILLAHPVYIKTPLELAAQLKDNIKMALLAHDELPTAEPTSLTAEAAAAMARDRAQLQKIKTESDLLKVKEQQARDQSNRLSDAQVEAEREVRTLEEKFNSMSAGPEREQLLLQLEQARQRVRDAQSSREHLEAEMKHLFEEETLRDKQQQLILTEDAREMARAKQLERKEQRHHIEHVREAASKHLSPSQVQGEVVQEIVEKAKDLSDFRAENKEAHQQMDEMLRDPAALAHMHLQGEPTLDPSRTYVNPDASVHQRAAQHSAQQAWSRSAGDGIDLSRLPSSARRVLATSHSDDAHYVTKTDGSVDPHGHTAFMDDGVHQRRTVDSAFPQDPLAEGAQMDPNALNHEHRQRRTFATKQHTAHQVGASVDVRSDPEKPHVPDALPVTAEDQPVAHPEPRPTTLAPPEHGMRPSVYHMRFTPHFQSTFRFFLDLHDVHPHSEVMVRLLQYPHKPACLDHYLETKRFGRPHNEYRTRLQIVNSDKSEQEAVPPESPCAPLVLAVSHGTDSVIGGFKHTHFDDLDAEAGWRHSPGRQVVLADLIEPGILYEVEVSYLSLHPEHTCELVNMEVVIEPLRALISEAEYFSCPNHGADRMPGFANQALSTNRKKIAPLVFNQAFFYSSDLQNETLYLQQRRHETRMETIPFESPVPFRFFAEIGFDFVAGLMGLRLVKLVNSEMEFSTKSSAHIHPYSKRMPWKDGSRGVQNSAHNWRPHAGTHMLSPHTLLEGEEFVLSGRVDQNRYVLAHDFLPAGIYLLHVFEIQSPAPHMPLQDEQKENEWQRRHRHLHVRPRHQLHFCSFFTMKIAVSPVPLFDTSAMGILAMDAKTQEKYVPLALQPVALHSFSTYPPLPDSLMTARHMRDKQYVHFAGIYALVLTSPNSPLFAPSSAEGVPPGADPSRTTSQSHNVMVFGVLQTSTVRAYVRLHTPAASFRAPKSAAAWESTSNTRYRIEMKIVSLTESTTGNKVDGRTAWQVPAFSDILSQAKQHDTKKHFADSRTANRGSGVHALPEVNELNHRLRNIGRAIVRHVSNVDPEDVWLAAELPNGLYALVVDVVPVRVMRGSRGSALPQWSLMDARVTADVEFSLAPLADLVTPWASLPLLQSVTALRTAPIVNYFASVFPHPTQGRCPCSTMALRKINMHGATFTYFHPLLWLCAEADSQGL
jgi:hypothetical protein